MRTLMSGDAWVHYGQIYVQSGMEWTYLAECFGGQRNGLCGGAMPGFLFLMTGLHTGAVAFAVELHDEAPPVDEFWEDIVEVSFRPEGASALVSWGAEAAWPLDLVETDYRARYCAARMDEGHDQDCRMEGEPEVDRYLLQFWPASPTPDRVVKQTSESAAYWHEFARAQPPPPSPRERAEAERRVALERERAAERACLAAEEAEWDGRLPGDRLRELRGNALSVARLDRPLVDALAEADPDTQRAIARWVTRRAFVEARLAEVEWIAPALAVMDQGQPLPPPFDDHVRAFEMLLSDGRIPHTTVTSLDGRHDNCLQQAMAFPTMFSAEEPDPLRAALDALWSAANGSGRERFQALFAEVRRSFPLHDEERFGP